MAHTSLFRLLRRVFKQAQHNNRLHSNSSSTYHQSKTQQTSAKGSLFRDSLSKGSLSRASLSRRRFLEYSTLASGGLVASTALAQVGATYEQSNPAIAIIGGGLAGLNTAYQLKKAGLTATVYEAKPQLGGRVQSVKGAVIPGLVNELGAAFINTEHEDMLELVEEFSLSLFNRAEAIEESEFPAIAYWLEGKSYTEAELAKNLQPLAQQIGQDAALLEADFDRYAPAIDQLSVKQYLDRHADKIPAPFVRKLIELTIRTEYGVEPEDSSALELLTNLPTVEGETAELLSSDEAFLVQGGSHKVVEKFADALSGQIQTNKVLTQIKSQGDRFQLTFRDRSIVEADYVVLAIPFTVLRQVKLQVELPATLRRFITEAHLGRNEKVMAGFQSAVWQQTAGFVGEAWTDLGFSAIWDDTQRQSDRPEAVLTFFLGGNEVDVVSSASARQVGTAFVQKLDLFLPGLKAEVGDRFHRTQWVKDPFVRGAYTTFKPGQYTEFSKYLYIESDDPEAQQNVHVGRLVFAGEHLSDDFYGYMNGAVQTGRLAAATLLRLYQERLV
jgi:monoamine oxidase